MRTGHKILILFSLLALIITSLCISAFLHSSEYVAAANLDELIFKITFPDGTDESLKAWPDDEDNKYYVFIPETLTGNVTLQISNLGSDDKLIIGDHNIRPFSNISGLTADTDYKFSLYHKDGRSEISTIVFKILSPLPTAFLTTESGNLEYISSDKTYSESGSLHLITESGFTDYSGSLCRINVRGNTSFEDPKKSFSFGTSKPHDLLGKGTSEGWYLLAQYQDITKLRIMATDKYISEHTSLPHTDFVYVNVYINNEYAGLYLFGKNKSLKNYELYDLENNNSEANPKYEYDISSQVLTQDGNIRAYSVTNDPSDITGGYILEIKGSPGYNAELPPDEYPAFISSMGYVFAIKSPDNASIAEAGYIKQCIDELECAIYSDNGINPYTGKHFTEYLDLDEWVDYYIAKEILLDTDIAGNASVYMCKDSDSGNPLLKMGPVWDLDRCLGNGLVMEYSHLADAEYLSMEMIYSDRILEYPETIEILKKKLNEHLFPWCEDDLEEDLNELYSSIRLSYDADLLRWPYSGSSELADTEYGNMNYMVDIMNRRCEFLRSYFMRNETWHHVSFVSDGHVINQYLVKEGNPLKYIPNPLNYLAFLAGWSCENCHETGMDDIRVYEDLVFEARWIEGAWLLSGEAEKISEIIENTDYITIDPSDLDGFYDTVINIVNS